MKRLLPTSHFLAMILLLSGTMWALFGSKADAYDAFSPENCPACIPVTPFEPYQTPSYSGGYEDPNPALTRMMQEYRQQEALSIMRQMRDMEAQRAINRSNCMNIQGNDRARQACFDSLY